MGTFLKIRSDKWPPFKLGIMVPRRGCAMEVLLVVLFCISSSFGEVLTPPYFNLAQGRRITASATCGETETGYPQREMFCSIVGASTDTVEAINEIHGGQACDWCEKGVDGNWHPAENAIDGSERWWQSPPLSRGPQYNEVNLTIDLGQDFHVAYVNMKMAKAPGPGLWALERSQDRGVTFQPWMYFAENPRECERHFGKESTLPITADDAVICNTQHSKILPLDGAEIFIRLLEGRPSAQNFFTSTALQEFTRATHVRLRLLKTKTLLAHLMSLSRHDSSVTRRYFYAIKGIEIGGRCRCNGHADICPPSNDDPYILLCSCRHNTCGPQCETCCPGYVQKAWRPSTNASPFACEACNCFGHSYECTYDPEIDEKKLSLDAAGEYDGGGVCQNCRHNTEGINCNKCKAGFYRPYGKPLDAIDVCTPCDCNFYYSTGSCEEGTGRCECSDAFLPPNCDACNVGYYNYPDCIKCDCHHNGTRGAVCEVGGGQCPCKQNYDGKNCDRCADGFYNFPDCLPCECENYGSVSPVCDRVNGQCECQNNFGGRQCNECEHGYYNFPSCDYCNCDVQGTREGICHKGSGECLCREGYGGARCDQCLQGFYGYPDCRPCNCSSVGSASTICDATGKCPCLPNFSSRACDQCNPGYYQYPECLPCTCHDEGSMGVSCDDEGKCQCKQNFDALRCEECRKGYYNFPLCEECNCDPAGVTSTFRHCSEMPPGELCQCKERVDGRICNICKPLYWNLQQSNPVGCEDCDCFGPGILGGVRVCESKTGQCPCKNHVGSQRCEQCKDGYYNLTETDIFGCKDCGCDVGGSVNNICDKENGHCPCRPRIIGQTCDTPLQAHYFPTLYQNQYEVEEGSTPTGGKVRFGYDESLFPGHSWRGYGIFSQLQPETIHDVYVEKSSLSLMVMRYHNPGTETITGEIKAVPDNPQDEVQSYKVKFEPGGDFLTVAIGNIPAPFVLNPGNWRFYFKIDQYMLLDYFTLLPEPYYEGTVLAQSSYVPCTLNTTARPRSSTASIIIPQPCAKYKFPSIEKFDSVNAAKGYVLTGTGDKTDIARFYSDKRVIDALEINDERMAILTQLQPELHMELPISKGGRYVLLLEYFTPQGANMTDVAVEATSRKGTQNGTAIILNCKYAFLCRQVVTTDDGEEAVFRFDSNSVNVVLRGIPPAGEEEGEVKPLDRIAVNRVTAIPIGKWSLDHITPGKHCVFKDNSCVSAEFDLPPGYLKIEAEVGDPDRIVEEDSMPEGVSGKGLVLLDSQQRMVEINGRVPVSGYYNVIVHYYQPENPEFAADVLIQDGQHYEAKVPFVHCPSIAGCRGMVAQADENTKFYIQDNFVVTVKSPKNAWIDYIILVRAAPEDPTDNSRQLQKYLRESPLDETRRFATECGKNHWHLPADNITDFCKDAVFSITAEYNDGALPCQCDYYGITDFECQQYGGQCQCKPNVIGRRCERCKTGYFGFPDCKLCDCPSTALCDELTGACICPPRVTGDKCDVCQIGTYGFDALIGCEDCNCSPLGVDNNNLQCDLQTGHCTCKTNVVGRTCDKCKPGFWAFPYCQMCDCDIRGTTDEICNQDTSACHCKINVEGRSCEQCKPGSFNLQELNPNGCTNCFCFGKTTRCTTSYMHWTSITFGKSNWNAVAIDPVTKDQNVIETNYDVEFENNGIFEEDVASFVPLFISEDTVPIQDENHILYFRVEIDANHLASVGGILSYNLMSEPDDIVNRDTFSGPEVILEGKELSPLSGTVRLMHYAVDHLDGENTLKMNLRLSEDNFVVTSHSTTGGLIPATRDQLMIVMKGLTAIYVRAGYWRQTRKIRLSSFSIEIGSEGNSNHYNQLVDDRAVTIEQCHCPPNYQGLSCEECAEGYYRSPTGPFGGFCVPCQCHGHSDRCDPVSGVCIDCKHNTTGDHCDMCDEGYHGDARGGTPYDCLICACPIPMASNNFATQCEVSPDGREISCTCKDGYIGPRCEGCGPGFYGRPETPGDFCKPCNCSGNIDTTDPYSCDTVTGACLRCMNNTGGPACNLCAAGFYGDALFMKDCRKCSCNSCGTYECNNENGDCQCLREVEGYLCDRCKPDYYGLSRCDRQGCDYCDCGIAAVSSQCDDLTGQCECRKGTIGRRCERCAPGYWNYTEDGCQACECNSEYAIGVGCDPGTGQCSCLPGVVGSQCDRCPWRWVLIEDRGCQGCDSCQHQLLDVTDLVSAELDPVKREFENVALSYFTTQKLVYFNDTVTKLKPGVQLMDPSKADLSEYYDGVNRVEKDAATQRQKMEVIEDSLIQKAGQSAKLKDKSVEVESKVTQAVGKATHTVFETKDLMEGLLREDKPSSSPQTDAAKAEAEAIIDALGDVTFDHQPAIEENSTVTTVLKDMKKFVRPLDKLEKDLSKFSEQIAETKEKLRDLRNQSDYAITTSRKANEIGNRVKDAKYSVKLNALESKASDMLENAGLATELNLQTPEILDALKSSYMDLDASVKSVREQREPLATSVDALVEELNLNENTVAESHDHARRLAYEADGLERTLARTRAYAERAVAAATSYKNIEESLNDALSEADKAKDAAENATEIINNLHSHAPSLVEPSHNLRVLAQSSQDQVENQLKIPLRDARSALENIEGANNITDYSLENFEKELQKLSTPTDMSDVRKSVRDSERSKSTAQEAQDNVEQILSKLPGHSDKMKKLRVTVSDLNSGTGISDSQLNQAKDSIPLSNAITGNLGEKKPDFDAKKAEIAAKLSDLKAQIAAAREQANRLGVGMNLQDTSSLLLANPQSLESQQAQTKVSFYFRTQDDGLIFYLGNEPGRKEEDFMSVEIDRGYPVVTFDLGSGPQRIMNEKYVADNQWYKAAVDRSGKSVRFTVSAEDPRTGRVEETVKEDYLTGSKSLFNLDRNSSKLFIGGLPPEVVRSPVRYSTYRGAIENLMIGDEKVGLWNFKDAQNVAPAQERDRLVDLQRETGLRFQGNGYAILDRRQFQLKERSAITFRFKTRSKNGLIFLVGKGRKYMSIYMANGKVVFQYDLGSGPATATTANSYNDGQWHTVEAIRYLQQSQLNVDTDRVGAVSPGAQEFLSAGDYMYWGGYPGDHGYPDISNRAFDGCLEQVNIDQAPVDLTQAVETLYTAVGCPSSQFAPTVATFYGQGYVKVSTADTPVAGPVVVNKDDTFEVNFRLKSNGTDGLIFYGTDGDQSNYLSAAMEFGSLVVKTEPGGAAIRTDALNDGDWHVVTVTRDKDKLVVNVDDDHEYVENAPSGPVQLNTPGSILLFGGRPDDYDIKTEAAATDTPYSGCLADISINGKRLDFTESVVQESSVGQKCFTPEEKEAMALEMNAKETNGRTIPKDEDDDNSIIPHHHEVHPTRPSADELPSPEGSELPDFSALDNLGKDKTEEEDDDWPLEKEEKKKKPDDDAEPTPFMQCALPYRDVPTAEVSESANMEEGAMFGSLERTSRIEYEQPKVDGSRSDYSIEFKTSNGDGLIFMWTIFEKTDYIALFMRKGYLHFAFDSGAGPAFLNSSVTFNDTKWHTASVSRIERSGELTVDGTPIATGESPGSTTEVNAGNTVFVGGLPPEGWSRKSTSKKLLGVDTPFKGCLKNFQIRDKVPKKVTLKHSVQPCQDQTESGMFFYPNSGFLRLSDNFKVGRHIKLSLSIKPRHPSGILVAVHGDKDFMVLQLINGTVKFTVDSGRGVLSSSYQKNTYDLCDGNWHTIRVTKSKNVVTLALDNFHSNPGIGQAGRDTTNTNGPLYVGGHPNPAGMKGIETTDQFVGCMKDFVIENRQYKLNYDSIIGTVGLHSCPKD